ncbi:MAG: pyridoxine 5'-phosphate synthase, partial [Candidatus Puniceispirillaceae bacterium]
SGASRRCGDGLRTRRRGLASRATGSSRTAARHAATVGIECHAGHGLDYDTVSPIAAIPNIEELNIGHFLIGESIFCGLPAAIEKMRHLIDVARRDMVGAD